MLISVVSAALGMLTLLVCASFNVSVLALVVIYVASAVPAFVMLLNGFVFNGGHAEQ